MSESAASRPFFFGRAGDGGLAGDADIAGGVDQGDAEAADLVDEAEREVTAGRSRPGRWRAGLILSSVVWRPVATSWTNWPYMLSTRDWK